MGRERVTTAVAAVAAALITLAMPATSSAESFGIDNSFGSKGVASITGSDPTFARHAVNAAVRAPDGDYLIGGSYNASPFNSGEDEMFLARFTSGGSPDSAFGGGDGYVSLSVGNDDDEILALELQADGKILAAGRANPANGDPVNFFGPMVVLRFNPDGSLDPSFGGDGRVQVDTGSQALGTFLDVAVDSAGKVYLVGTQSGAPLVRLNADGSPDLSFDSDGQAGPDDWRGVAVEVGPDDKPVVAAFEDFDSPVRVLRFNGDGSLDPAYGSGGISASDSNLRLDVGMVLAPDGGAYLTGAGGDGAVNAERTSFELVRYTAAGELDTSFGDRGLGTIDYRDRSGKKGTAGGLTGEDPDRIELLPGGKIAVYAEVQDSEGRTAGAAVGRFLPNGAPDTGFGRDGVAVSDEIDFRNGITSDPDGSIVIAGAIEEEGSSLLAAVRFQPNAPDPSSSAACKKATKKAKKANKKAKKLKKKAKKAKGKKAKKLKKKAKKLKKKAKKAKKAQRKACS